jgi:hypothetical protein
VVAASGLTFLGIGAAFWALLAGLTIRAVLPPVKKVPGMEGKVAEEAEKESTRR